MSSTILGTALPAFVAHADGTTLYVNNAPWDNCSDSGAGTQAQPFCTVQAAANVVQAGQTVLIAPNTTYPEQVTVKNSGAPGNPITFKGPGASSVRTMSTVLIGTTSGVVDATTPPHAFVFPSGTHDVTVTGLRMTTPQEAVLVTDSDHIVVDGNDISPATGGGVSAAPAVRLTGRTTASTVSRNRFRSISASGIAVDAGVAGTVVTTNLINADHGPGIIVTDAPGTVVTSNSVGASCGGAIALAGASANSTVENNVITELISSTCQPQPDLSVSAASTNGTKADYNVLSYTGRVSYAWGTETASSQAEFTQKSGGQGSHDFTPNSVPFIPSGPSVTTDSADANAPGELDTDISGNPRVDDPQVPNTGTGTGYYDRGALELQDPLQASVSAAPVDYFRPFDENISVSSSGGWGSVTGTLDFGDGSPKQTVGSGTSTVPHTYPDIGNYTVTLTMTDGSATRTSTTTAAIQVPPLQPSTTESQVDWQVPAVTFSEDTANGSPWPVTGYTLDFGDGSPKSVYSGSLPNCCINHTYPRPGTYTVTSTVTDAHGRTGTSTQSIEVRAVLPFKRTIEASTGGWLEEIYSDGSGGWHVGSIQAGRVSTMAFSYSPSGARVIEAVEGYELHEIYSAPDGWHDNAIEPLQRNFTTMGFAYSPSGARVLEVVENNLLHEIYSAPDGWHDNVINGVAGAVSAMSFSYSPSGARVIEAIEYGTLHEIYSAPDGWHDNPIEAVNGNGISAMSLTYSPSGARVIEAIDNGTLHEIYSAADGWHDAAVPGVGSNVNSLSVKIRPTGDRVIEAIENNELHEIYSNAGSWYDSPTPTYGKWDTASLALP